MSDSTSRACGDSHPSTGDSHPSTGDSHPSIDDSHPSIGNSHPSIGDSQPNIDDSHPGTGDSHPCTGESHPSTGDSHPSTDDSHPSTGDSHTCIGESHPSTGDSHTGTGDSQPGTGDSHPGITLAQNSVLAASEEMPAGSETVRGYDFNQGVNYHDILSSYRRSGFQATNFGLAVQEINKMISMKREPVSEAGAEKLRLNPVAREGRRRDNCTIFLGYTSNLVSSGLREVFKYLVQHSMVDVVVSTAGGVEEDLVKCLAPTYLGDFALPGRPLREKGINRIGNLLVPNANYCKFEDWIMPIFDQMLREQREQNTLWTPSRVIHRLGREINHPDSIYYWAYKNDIPVFCPPLTDGSIGDMLYFHSYRNPGLVIDIVKDMQLMNAQAVYAAHSGMIILGGGVVKHHICNANLMRNGADYSVFVNTAQEFDGSDSGARPDEAVSWGKIRPTATPVKVYGEATLLFPLLVAETFATHHESALARNKDARVRPETEWHCACHGVVQK